MNGICYRMDRTLCKSSTGGLTMEPIETIAEDMYQLITECTGKKNLKAGDLTKAMIAKHGEAACSKDDCKKAIRLLIDSGRCVYSYLGGSYIQLPPEEEV
jgi:hypothetical protein